MSSRFTESVVEDAALAWLEELNYAVLHGPEIAPGESAEERDGLDDVVMKYRLWEALRKLNPTLPREARESRVQRQAGWVGSGLSRSRASRLAVRSRAC